MPSEPTDTAACGCNPAGPGPDNAWGDGPPYYDEDCPVHGRPEIIGRPATAAQPTHVADALGRLWRIVRADGQVVQAFVEGWCVIYVR